METEGFAIYDAMMQMKTEVYFLLIKNAVQMIIYMYFLLTFIDDCTC